MKAFVIFALVAVAAARPDIGLQLQGGGYSGGSFGSASGFSSGGNSFGGSGFGGSGGSFGGGAGVQQGQSQVIDISGGGSASSIVYKPVIREGPPQISKSFYVHEAPDDAVNVEVREKEIQVRPQKHYKIIFIKAPSGGSAAIGGNAAIFPQSEEKTIVYVLSKKPEGAVGDDGDFPQPPAPVTSKPEVFFVKYKTQQEAESAISNIQQSFQEGGQGYNNPAGFAAALGASSGSASSSSFSGPIARDFSANSDRVNSEAQQMIEIPADNFGYGQ